MLETTPTPHTIEERIRKDIDIRTQDHGVRAELSRRVGQKRGWLTDYVTGKIKYIRVDELARLAPLIGLDVSRLFRLADQRASVAAIAKQVALIASLWARVSARERTALLGQIVRAASRDRDLSASPELSRQSPPDLPETGDENPQSSPARGARGRRRP
jgi:transcriptional regulator with XRE-family HTH domain